MCAMSPGLPGEAILRLLLAILPSAVIARFRNTKGSCISENQHRIAVAEETVALADGFGVGRQNEFAAGEGADQHNQGRARKMEIGEERVDHFEFAGRMDEDIGASLACFAARAFQNT